MQPTLAGFLNFIQNQMGISTIYLPANSPAVSWAYNVALDIVLQQWACISPTIYTLMVYNLGGSNLINFAQDQVGQTYFADLRQKWNINGFVGGVVQGTSDVSTAENLLVPDAFKTLTLADLQYLKDPYGRQYLAFAQRFGPLWGVS